MAKLLSGTRIYGNTTIDTTVTVGNIVITGAANTTNGITFVDGTRQITAAFNPNLPSVLNDISNQFDNLKCVFNLAVDQANVSNTTIIHSGNIEVVVNGYKLSPYVKQNTYPWLVTYDSYKGYRVVSTNTQSKLIIYNAPAPGEQATVSIINNSSVPQTRKYPFSAATIALGD